MPAIIGNLPFFEKHTTVTVAGGAVRIKPYQIIIWVSIGEMGTRVLPPNTPRFPAILDLGHSHNFSITEEHLEKWAGIDPEGLESLGTIRVSEQRLHLLNANVWLHLNRFGQRDEFSGQPPLSLEMDSGIAAYPKDTTTAPRLPLLGLRGLRRADLQLHVDCQKCRVSIRTPRRFWWFT